MDYSSSQTDEVDDSISLALKTALSRDSSDWTTVCDKWKKTYSLRQQELSTTSNHSSFLKSWPKYGDARATQLIEIDFEIMYPGKQHLLLSKWEHFKIIIKRYYEANIHNPNCKKQLRLLNSNLSSGNILKDSEDFILAILLNSVLPASSRFKDRNGSNKRKVSIADAQESFALRIPSIQSYQENISELVNKYYNIGLTIQPFILCVGQDDYNIHEYYVYLDKTLFKFDSFIEALDLCFKTFQVLSLKYPLACQSCWLFIQKYFFNIESKFDFKSSNITSLLNFFKNQS
ncbi:uncharacterized protein LOC129942008 [Eupeodes corollae]|uniref:uncharacterized protein LOC129942008 n=1 Tax=Eupeodes corollae TaxID=290404 RepID=UPI00248F9F56|nr:uncharacterized protein LOC129942008 [Eupeodes corollae]